MKEKKWYKLDNAGKIYPSVMRTRISTVFRLSITITKTIDSKLLQRSLDNIIERFPYFKVNLHRGLFWYYYDYSEKNPYIEKEIYYPCMFLNYKKKESFPFRVLYFDKRMSLEISHSITDGMGALLFFKILILEYFKLLKIDFDYEESEIKIDEEILENEWEDSFHKYYKKGIPVPDMPKKAVHFPMSLVEKGEYIILSGILKTEDLKLLSKKYNCTITQFLVALYFETIQEYINNLPYKLKKKKQGRIVLSILMNLRKMYPSKTMKNFFVGLSPEIDLRLGEYKREELIEYVKNYMKLNITEKNISKYVSRNVANERSLFLKTIPLFLKNIILPVVYNLFGESSYTSSISNLGIIKFPKELEKYISDFEFFPPPSRLNKVKLGIVSFKDKMYISFGKLTRETDLEKIFFRKLRKEEIRIKVRSNVE